MQEGRKGHPSRVPLRTLYTKKLTKKGNRRVPRMLSQGRRRVYVFVMSIKRAELADRTPLTYLPLPCHHTARASNLK